MTDLSPLCPTQASQRVCMQSTAAHYSLVCSSSKCVLYKYICVRMEVAEGRLRHFLLSVKNWSCASWDWPLPCAPRGLGVPPYGTDRQTEGLSRSVKRHVVCVRLCVWKRKRRGDPRGHTRRLRGHYSANGQDITSPEPVPGEIIQCSNTASLHYYRPFHQQQA